VNDLLVLALYIPTMILLLGVSSIALPYDTVAVSVALFIAAPLAVAVAVRLAVLRWGGGQAVLDRVIAFFKPVTMVGLLATLVLIFIMQGPTIGSKPLHILLIAVPLVLQTFAIFAITYAAGYYACVKHDLLAPAALISTSNFFELAVAVAVGVYGADSGAALATVVGVLVEVPTMLVLVWIANRLKPRLDARLQTCDCAWMPGLPQCCGAGAAPPSVREAGAPADDAGCGCAAGEACGSAGTPGDAGTGEPLVAKAS
jgi:arsenite transporter